MSSNSIIQLICLIVDSQLAKQSSLAAVSEILNGCLYVHSSTNNEVNIKVIVLHQMLRNGW
jgi:hypothetical protein